MVKIYLSGPISLNGRLSPAQVRKNIEAFAVAEEHFKSLGYEVLNPCALPKQESWEDYMRLAIPMVCEADGVVVLKGFGNSRGSVIEILVAQSIGNSVETFDADSQ